MKKEANVGKGITFEGFKSFYNVLFGGADLERAMFFLNTEKSGINRYRYTIRLLCRRLLILDVFVFIWHLFFIMSFSKEFMNIARWVADCDVDDHIVEVIYALLDDDGDRNLSIKEFTPVLFQWRRSRGFQHQSVQISMGKLQI